MCFHSEEDMQRYYDRAKQRTREFIVMRDPQTQEFQEAYHVDVHDEQSIANTIRNLRAWHPGERAVDLTRVNQARFDIGLYRVIERSQVGEDWPLFFIGLGSCARDPIETNDSWYYILPEPTGVAPPSEDPNASVDTVEAMKTAAPAFATPEQVLTVWPAYGIPDEFRMYSVSYDIEGVVQHLRRRSFPSLNEIISISGIDWANKPFVPPQFMFDDGIETAQRAARNKRAVAHRQMDWKRWFEDQVAQWKRDPHRYEKELMSGAA